MIASLIDWLIKSLKGKIILISRIALMFYSKSHLHRKAINRQKNIFNSMCDILF